MALMTTRQLTTRTIRGNPRQLRAAVSNAFRSIVALGSLFLAFQMLQGQVPGDLKANLLPMGVSDKKRPSHEDRMASSEPPTVCPIKDHSKEPPIPDSMHGHHSVTLTWKPSAQPGNSAKMYYCLYRRKAEKKAAPKRFASDILNCGDCQLVTQVPIESSGCIDERVWDDASYDYAVIAITNNAKDVKRSPTSEPAHADISSQAEPMHAPAVSYPACWPQSNTTNK